MTSNRGVKVGVAVGVLLIAVLVGLVLWQRDNYQQWPWQSLPDRLDHCHRSYAPGNWVDAEDAPSLEYDFRLAPVLAAHHDVYREPDKLFTNQRGEQCRMGYFVQDGSGYRVYGLLGGP